MTYLFVSATLLGNDTAGVRGSLQSTVFSRQAEYTLSPDQLQMSRRRAAYSAFYLDYSASYSSAWRVSTKHGTYWARPFYLGNALRVRRHDRRQMCYNKAS
jgi:hypothetical protein